MKRPRIEDSVEEDDQVAVEYVVDELGLFSGSDYQVTVTENSLVPASPVNSIDQTSHVEFYLPPANNIYRNLGEMYIHVSAQILKGDGEKYKSTDTLQGTLVSNFTGNLFKDAKLLLNNQQVISVDNDYPIIQFIENCTNFDTLTAANRLKAAGIFSYDDTAKLKSHTANSVVRDYYARLNLVNLNRFIIPNVGVSIRMTLNDEAYYILEIADDDTKTEANKVYTSSKVKIHGINLYYRQYQVRDDYNLWLEEQLNAGINANYEFFSSKINTVSIPINTISHNIGALYTGPKPSLMIFGLVENSRYIGNRNFDPHVFKDHGLIEFSFVINGKQTPTNTWQLSNTKEEIKMAHLFHQFHSVINMGE